MMRLQVSILMLTALANADDSCSVDDNLKRDCGHMDQDSCVKSGCCWKEAHVAGQNIPWCFYKAGGSACNPKLIMSAEDPGFTDDLYNKMLAKYMSQLNIQGSGAVVAAPTHNTPGGSYFYHWMRDGALSMKVFMDINDNDMGKIEKNMNAYQSWVSKVQQKQDPNNIDVRIEPKFEIPSGEPYAGGWCRPQTDGPALRALTLCQWSQNLIRNGKKQEAQDNVWPLIKNDLSWVVDNWTSEGCDLWEEVRSQSFLWNRMAYVHVLQIASSLAGSSFSDQNLMGIYKDTAQKIEDTILQEHWNGNYLVSASNRPVDGSVLHSAATFPNAKVSSANETVAKTIEYYNEIFCQGYPINNKDTSAGTPGVLYGRYPGDVYAGGNPWQLLSAGLAEVYYLKSASLAKMLKSGDNFKGENLKAMIKDLSAWRKVLDDNKYGLMDLSELGEQIDVEKELTKYVAASMAAGDAVMKRIYAHVKSDDGRIDEQLDKNDGTQKSAQSLTWSYANILHALHVRKSLAEEIDGLRGQSDTLYA